MFVVLVAVGERPRLPTLLEQPQVVGALVVARVACGMDRVAGIGLGAVLVFLDLEVVSARAAPDIVAKKRTNLLTAVFIGAHQCSASRPR